MRAELIACFVTLMLFTTGVVVAETRMSERNVLKGREAFGGWHKDRPGVRRLLDADEMEIHKARRYGESCRAISAPKAFKR